MATPTEVLIEVTRVLEDLQIPYFVVGSFASSARGVRRATVDGDIVADIRRKNVEDIVERLSSRDFYIDDLAVRRAIEWEKAFNAIHRESMFKIDVYVSRDDFSKKEMERKLPEKILPDSDTIIYIATAEDTVVAKLSWFRKGGEVSDRQWSDVLGILKVQKNKLDYEYIREWSERLGVGDLLDKVLTEV
jgi:hypothetical protein